MISAETTISKTGPTINKGRSCQTYETPESFLDAVKGRFGNIVFDLAASPNNAKAKNYFTEQDDSLKQEWDGFGNLWLNPPFANITPWARKCAESKPNPYRRILFLVPASVDSEWYRLWVQPHAYVLAINPRLTFVGCTDPYPRGLILAVYGNELRGFDTWRWK